MFRNPRGRWWCGRAPRGEGRAPPGGGPLRRPPPSPGRTRHMSRRRRQLPLGEGRRPLRRTRRPRRRRRRPLRARLASVDHGAGDLRCRRQAVAPALPPPRPRRPPERGRPRLPGFVRAAADRGDRAERGARPVIGVRTVVTIGVYGFDQAAFLAALARARVKVLLDVRQRRGVRGSEYAWANSARLQAALADAGIEYRHRYTREILDRVDLQPIVASLPADGAAALLCVERDPEACNRSLIADRMASEHGVTVRHLKPS